MEKNNFLFLLFTIIGGYTIALFANISKPNFQQAQITMNQAISPQSSAFIISIGVNQILINNNIVQLTTEINYSISSQIAYFYFDNSTLVDYGALDLASNQLNLTQDVFENGDHVLQFQFLNETADIAFETTIPVQINSIIEQNQTGNTNVSIPINQMSILFIGLTVGSVVVISSGTTYYVTKRRNYHDSDLPKGSSFYSATNRNFSLFGSPPSHFYNVIHSNIIPVKNRVKFLLQCSTIGDIRIYYRQDMKLIFKITPQPYLFNSVKVNLLNESYKAIMMDFSEDPKFVEMKVNDQKFQVQIIGTPHLLLVISYSFDFKERSDDFDFANTTFE